MRNMMKKYLSLTLTLLLLTVMLPAPLIASDKCPSWMNHDFKQLHSINVINLCEMVGNKPVLVVNTASHCGFTYQFTGLEKLHQRYKDQGLVVVGFSSNDFNQEAATEAKTANICYFNYGVKFTMMAPISVKGESAHRFFKSLAEKSQMPSWNFNKFLIDPSRKTVTHFSTQVSPESSTLRLAIEQVL
jgi:glutathione peroxidase